VKGHEDFFTPYSRAGRVNVIRSASFAIRQIKNDSSAILSSGPQPTEWQRIGNQINAAFIFTRTYFINVLRIDRHIEAVSLSDWHC
jgi:hypothetical protein